MAALERALKELAASPERVQRLTEWSWIRVALAHTATNNQHQHQPSPIPQQQPRYRQEQDPQHHQRSYQPPHQQLPTTRHNPSSATIINDETHSTLLIIPTIYDQSSVSKSMRSDHQPTLPTSTTPTTANLHLPTGNPTHPQGTVRSRPANTNLTVSTSSSIHDPIGISPLVIRPPVNG
jgi:hypothetical protein